MNAADGTALLHMDLRADNLLLTADGRVMVVDWPWACVGAPWLDLVTMMPSVWMRGGPETARILFEHPVVLAADPDAVTAVVAGYTGFFLRQGHQSPPLGLPTVRAFQTAQGVAALEWLRTRVDWE